MVDFLCIGAQKAGTTWLSAQLERNPAVWVHPFKELHYFDHLHCPPNRAWTLRHLQRAALRLIEAEMMQENVVERFARVAYLARCADQDWAFTQAWYGYAFSAAPEHVRKGECTPAYAGIGPQGVAHVRRLLPDVRIIYLIRDPVERAWSQIRMNIGRRPVIVAGGAITENLLIEEARTCDVAQRGNYCGAIEDWEEAFGDTGQILYLPYAQIARDPEGLMARVEAHVGVGPGERTVAGARINASPEIVLPGSVKAFLQEATAPQYVFLQQRFGAEFMVQI